MAGRWAELYKKLIDDATAKNIPISGFFELTPRCNFHCRMCYVCSMPGDKKVIEKELGTEQWIGLGKEARDNGLLFLTLTGGEIFIRNDFWNIYDAYCDMGFITTLFTNGSLLTADKVKRLGKKPPSKVSITIYGASPETYGLVTGHPEAYDSTVRAIKMLIDEGIKVDLKTTVIKHNSAEFERLADFTESLGIMIKVVNYVSPRREGMGTDPEEVRLSPAELIAYEKRIMEYNEKLALRRKESKGDKLTGMDPERNTASLDEDTMLDTEIDKLNAGRFDKAMEQSAFKCLTGKCGFWLSWDGRLLPCGLLSEPYSEPLKSGFGKAWEQLRGFCSSIPVCEECEACSYRSRCMTCPARLMSETGSFVKPAEYLCRMAEERVINNVKY